MDLAAAVGRAQRPDRRRAARRRCCPRRRPRRAPRRRTDPLRLGMAIVGGRLALVGLFVAAMPYTTTDGFEWSAGWLVSPRRRRRPRRSLLVLARRAPVLEPLGAIGVLAVAGLLVLWDTGTDTSASTGRLGARRCLRGRLRRCSRWPWSPSARCATHPVLTWIAMVGLVVFTTFQSFAVFAPIVQGAWLFLVLGTGLPGHRVPLRPGQARDRAGLDLDARHRPEGAGPMKSSSPSRSSPPAQAALVGVAVAPQLSARVTGDTYLVPGGTARPDRPVPRRLRRARLPRPAPRRLQSSTGIGTLDDGIAATLYITLVEEDGVDGSPTTGRATVPPTTGPTSPATTATGRSVRHRELVPAAGRGASRPRSCCATGRSPR